MKNMLKYRRNPWKRLTLRWKLPIMIAVPTVTVLLIVAFVTYFQSAAGMEVQRRASTSALLHAKAQEIDVWFETVRTQALQLAGSPGTREAIAAFGSGWDRMGATAEQDLQRLYVEENPNPPGEKLRLDNAGDFSHWSLAHLRFHPSFRDYIRVGDFYDLFLFDLDGNTIYTVYKEPDFATNVLSGPYADSGLGRVFAAANTLEAGEAVFSGYSAYAPSNGLPANFVAAPVFDALGGRLGVVALQINIDTPARKMAENDLLGVSGDMYAFDENGRALSATQGGELSVLDEVPQRPDIEEARAGGDVAAQGVTGLRGNLVEMVGLTRRIGGQDWHLVAEQDLWEARAQERTLLRATLVQTGIVAVLVMLLGVLVAGLLTRRITALAVSVNAVAGGDYETTISQTKTGDEIGDIARALDSFRGDLGAVAKTRTQMQETAAQQARVVETLQEALVRLAGGDLSCRVTQDLGAEYEALRGHFNRTVEALSTIIGDLRRNAEAIDDDAKMLNDAATALSERTENQAATLEESAAAMDEISESVNATATGARDIVAAIGIARETALEGEDVRNRAVAAMDAIEGSSKQIETIIKVIEDISFQTNLLSLNAGVEAARAGEAGLGFSVVATEVRGLAQRSAENAAEIRSLIAASGKNVAQGVELVSDLGKAMERILREVITVAEQIQSIADGAGEQAQGIGEINNGIAMLDQVTQQNAAMVNESVAASRALREKALGLRQLVARFSDHPAAPSHHEPRAPEKEGQRASPDVVGASPAEMGRTDASAFASGATWAEAKTVAGPSQPVTMAKAAGAAGPWTEF